MDPDTAGVLLEWGAVEQVNGWDVTHYEVQRSASPWTTLADDVTATIYLDEAPDSDNPDYRVRAVNEHGVPGPWSQSAGRRPGVPPDFSATIADSTQVNLTWSAPAEVAGVTVTGYDVAVSADGGDNWSSLASEQSALTYDHTGLMLSPGDVRQYRVRTVGMAGSKKLKSGWATARAEVAYPNRAFPRTSPPAAPATPRPACRGAPPTP